LLDLVAMIVDAKITEESFYPDKTAEKSRTGNREQINSLFIAGAVPADKKRTYLFSVPKAKGRVSLYKV
jgi:hypothetical protein